MLAHAVMQLMDNASLQVTWMCIRDVRLRLQCATIIICAPMTQLSAEDMDWVGSVVTRPRCAILAEAVTQLMDNASLQAIWIYIRHVRLRLLCATITICAPMTLFSAEDMA